MSRWPIRSGASLSADHSTSSGPISPRGLAASTKAFIRTRVERKEANESREMKSAVLLYYGLCLLIGVRAIGRYRGLEFLEPCSRHDPKLETCLAKTANVLVEHFRQGKTLSLDFVCQRTVNVLFLHPREEVWDFLWNSRGESTRQSSSLITECDVVVYPACLISKLAKFCRTWIELNLESRIRVWRKSDETMVTCNNKLQVFGAPRNLRRGEANSSSRVKLQRVRMFAGNIAYVFFCC